MKRKTKPVEEQSYKMGFFACGIAFFVVSGWAVYDEVVLRRPWKGVQERFIAVDIANADEQIKAAQQVLDKPEIKKKIQQAREELSQEKERQKSDAAKIQAARNAIKAQEVVLEEVKLALTFAKSVRDEAYYFYKHSQHAGSAAENKRKQYSELEAGVKQAQKDLTAQQAKVGAVYTALDALVGKSRKLSSWLEDTHRDLKNAKRRRVKAGERTTGIKQTVISALGAVDRCETCHLSINRKGFEDPKKYPHPYRTHPNLDTLIRKSHPFNKFGCTTCHHGQGSQIKGVDHHPFDHGRDDHYWDTPLLRGDYTQASCRKCHAQQRKLKFAPVLTESRQLFEHFMCASCHDAPGFENFPKQGPSLDHAQPKYKLGWLAQWIKNPKSVRKETRMPNFWPEALDADGKPKEGSEALKKRDREVARIIAYLTSISTDPSAEVTLPEADLELGKQVVEQKGCRGCHLMWGEKELTSEAVDHYRAFAPELDNLKVKTSIPWIANWMLNPRSYWKGTRMPNLRLNPKEAVSAATYLHGKGKTGDYAVPAGLEQALQGSQLTKLAAEGKKLVGYYGCFGCHDIKGFEKAVKIGVPLGDFGAKLTERLDYGDVITDPKKQTWMAWVKQKLHAPRSYKTERIALKMPQFDMTDKQIHTLTVLIKSFVEEKIPKSHMYPLTKEKKDIINGERLITRYGCRNCHIVNKEGGFVRAYYKDKLAYAPPILNGEGNKVVPNWLYGFLNNPIGLRPWLKIRMPTINFTPAERRAVVRYFMSVDGKKETWYAPATTPMSDEEKKLGLQAFTTLKCLDCHSVSDAPSSGNTDGDAPKLEASNLAPNLSLSRHRLRYEWIIDWLKDPQKIQPETKMPTFFPLEDDDDPTSFSSPLPDVLDGDALKQIHLITNHLFHME